VTLGYDGNDFLLLLNTVTVLLVRLTVAEVDIAMVQISAVQSAHQASKPGQQTRLAYSSQEE